MWALIFERVTVPMDLLNIFHAADDWYGMLEQKRKYFLFPQVLEILRKQGSLRQKKSEVQVIKGMEFHKKPKSLLNCREVCKPPDGAVQDYMQFHPTHFNVKIPIDGTALHEVAYTFCKEEQVRSFVRTFQESHCSPDRNHL